MPSSCIILSLGLSFRKREIKPFLVSPNIITFPKLKKRDMFKFFKEAAGPAIFTKGLLKYQQGRFEDSKKLILKAGECTPDLKSDAIFKATLLLVESKLGTKYQRDSFREALESLRGSALKDTSSYSYIVEELKKRIMGNGI